VVARGAKVLGERALNSSMVEPELEMILGACALARENSREAGSDSPSKTARRASQRGTPPRRKTTAAA
jgi:hypothetical protein